MGRRRLAREIALQALYVADVAHTPALEAFAIVTRREGEEVDTETLDFARELALGAIERVSELDLTIQEQAANWSMARMAAVDRNVLRLAAHELESRPDAFEKPATSFQRRGVVGRSLAPAERPCARLQNRRLLRPRRRASEENRPQ